MGIWNIHKMKIVSKSIEIIEILKNLKNHEEIVKKIRSWKNPFKICEIIQML